LLADLVVLGFQVRIQEGRSAEEMKLSQKKKHQIFKFINAKLPIAGKNLIKAQAARAALESARGRNTSAPAQNSGQSLPSEAPVKVLERGHQRGHI